MENNSTYYVDLLARYFSGEASPAEITELSVWLKSNPQNEKLFEEYQKTWITIEGSRIDKEINVEEEWGKIKPHLLKTKETPVVSLHTERTLNRSFFYKAMRIAAIIVVFSAISFIVYNYLNQPKTEHLVAQNEAIENKLPDGTSVTLNAGSSLDYPERFKDHKRNVTLKGEAYFNVTRDTSKPFIISAEDVMVKVLGTSFYVNTNSSTGNGEVILTSGRVEIYYKNNPGKSIILAPGEKAVFSKTEQKITKTENDDFNYMAFKTKNIVFNNTPLDNVVKTLNDVYHSKIKLGTNNIANYTLSGNYTNLNLDDILKIIQVALPVSINKTSGNVIEISGNGSKK